MQFLQEIGRNEAADYDTAFGMVNGKSPFITPEKFSGKKLTEMTLNEVFAYQRALRKETKKAKIQNGRGSSAVGRGQFLEDTLKEKLTELKITDFSHTKFTPELQDRLIIQNAKSRHLDPNQVESWDAAKKAKLGKQWESLDVSKGKIRAEDLEEVIARIGAQGPGRPPKTVQLFR